MFKNFWWPLACVEEVTQKPMRVTALQQEFVLYRLPTGEAQVMSDLCVHRGGALSDGWLAGDCLVCPYHGWQFKKDGACVMIPANQAGVPVPRKARVDSYPTVERGGFVWAYLGDLPEAERPPLPEVNGAAGTAHGVIRWNAPYERVWGLIAAPTNAALALPGPLENAAATVDNAKHATVGAFESRSTFTLAPPRRVVTSLMGLRKTLVPSEPVQASVNMHAPCFQRVEVGAHVLQMSHLPIDDSHTITRWRCDRDLGPALEALRAEVEQGAPQTSPEAAQIAAWGAAATQAGWRIDTHVIQAEFANIKAVVIPSPARREVPELAAAWVMKEVPTK